LSAVFFCVVSSPISHTANSVDTAVFGNPAPAPGAFGAPAPGGFGSSFGTPASGSLFGGNPAPAPGGSLFGGSPTSAPSFGGKLMPNFNLPLFQFG